MRNPSMLKRRNLLIAGGAALIAGAGAAGYGIRQMGSMADYTARVAAQRAPLPANPQAQDLIRFATLAANSHNTQAWSFRVAGNSITLLPDLARATPVVDPDNHHLFVSLGCAAENLSIAAASRGMPGEVRFDQGAGGAIHFAHATAAATDTALSDAIPLRQSTRGIYDGSSLTPAELGQLAESARVPGVDLILITDRGQIGQLGDLIATGNTAQIADPAFMAELKQWMRFTPRHALHPGDGLFSATSGNPVMPDWLGRLVLDWALYGASRERHKHRQDRLLCRNSGVCGGQSRCRTLGSGWPRLSALCVAGHSDGLEIGFPEPTGRGGGSAASACGADRCAGPQA